MFVSSNSWLGLPVMETLKCFNVLQGIHYPCILLNIHSIASLPDTKCRLQTRVLEYFSGPRSPRWIRASQRPRRFLAELLGSMPLMNYNFRQAIKADALSTLRILITANYCANNHRSLNKVHRSSNKVQAQYTNMVNVITCTHYDIKCNGSIHEVRPSACRSKQ